MDRKWLNSAAYVLVAALMASVILPLTPVQAQVVGPTVTSVTPNILGAGNSIVVSAEGFPTSTNVLYVYLSKINDASIHLGDILLTPSGVPASGGVLNQQNVTVPSTVQPGTWYVKVTNSLTAGSGQVATSGQVIVLPPPAPTIRILSATDGRITQATPGTKFRVLGFNFPSTLNPASVNIYLLTPTGPLPLASSVTLIAPGVFLATGLTVPNNIVAGRYQVLAVNSTIPPYTTVSTAPVVGASTPLTVISALFPVLTQYFPSVMPGGQPLWSIGTTLPHPNLSFAGVDLPAGTVTSVTIYNINGQAVATGTTTNGLGQPYTVGPDGRFVSTYEPYGIPYPAVNVTLSNSLPPGVGYYAVFQIGGISVKSQPFIVSSTDNSFKAFMSPFNNPYVVVSQITSSGSVRLIVQGYGWPPGHTVYVVVQNGAATLASTSVTVDPNGAIYASINTDGTHFPNQTAGVYVYDPQVTGQINIGTYKLVPRINIIDTILEDQQGFVTPLDPINIWGTSFPYQFEATNITFRSLTNGYTATITEDASGNPLTGYTSISSGDFKSAGSPLMVLLPNLPGGNVTVTLNGALFGGKPFSITTWFWVDSFISNAYYIDLPDNAWEAFTTFNPSTSTYTANVFPGDILELNVTGFPVKTEATVNFTGTLQTSMATNIMGTFASENGNTELIVYVPQNLLPSASFGEYFLLLNNASFDYEFGQTQLIVEFGVNVLSPPALPTGYSGTPPHVYVNPQDVTPVSQVGGVGISGVFPASYPVGSELTIYGVGFEANSQEYVYLANESVSPFSYPKLLATPKTSALGTFNFTTTLPNETSYYFDGMKYKAVVFSIGVFQSNPNALVQSPTTSYNTYDQAQAIHVEPEIALSPTQGTPNTTVTVVGTGFASGETVAIYTSLYTLVPFGEVFVSNTGFFEATFLVPAYPPGPITVYALGSSNQTFASAPFTVLSTVPPSKPTVSATLTVPPTASEGQTITIQLNVQVNGTAYTVPLQDISASVLLPNNTKVPLTFSVVGTGQYQAKFTVPALAGAYLVTATVTYDNVSTAVSASFTVQAPPPPSKPTVTATLVAPSTAYVGESVLMELDVFVNGQPTNVPLSNISGTVLLPNGVTQSLSFIRSGTGVYTTIFPVPNITGTYHVSVTVTYDGVTTIATAEFSVPPPVTVPPVNTSPIVSTLSSIASAQAALQSSLSQLQTALSNLAAQTTAAINALSSSLASIASSLSSLGRQQSTATTYSLGALVIAFIALIVIIYGVFIRRMP